MAGGGIFPYEESFYLIIIVSLFLITSQNPNLGRSLSSHVFTHLLLYLIPISEIVYHYWQDLLHLDVLLLYDLLHIILEVFKFFPGSAAVKNHYLVEGLIQKILLLTLSIKITSPINIKALVSSKYHVASCKLIALDGNWFLLNAKVPLTEKVIYFRVPVQFLDKAL